MNLVRINGRYRLEEKAGFGSFGEVYLAHDILSGQEVVIKLEPVAGDHHTLEHELHVYQKLSGGIGIPCVRWFGMEGGFNAMAIDRLGPSLEDLFVRCHFRFTVRTVLLLAHQLVCRLQYIHSRNFLHRDLKPNNIVIGVGKHAHTVHLIDFGLSKEFRDPDTHRHIPYKAASGLVGSAVFASVQSHLGMELGRRDDLESLAYMLVYFLRGSLPWQGLEFGGLDLVVKSKQGTSIHDLCLGLPTELRIFLEYARSLSFNDKPDYGYLCGLFGKSSPRDGSENDFAFDWDGSACHLQEQPGNLDGKQDKPSRIHSKRRTGLRSQTIPNGVFAGSLAVQSAAAKC